MANPEALHHVFLRMSNDDIIKYVTPVCRAWKRIVTSPPFIRDRSLNRFQKDKFIFITHQESNLMEILDVADINKSGLWSSATLPSGFDLLAASGGLMLFFSQTHHSLLVYNPLTKEKLLLQPLREAEPFLKNRRHKLGFAIAVEESTCSFAVFLLGNLRREQLVIARYNSLETSWTVKDFPAVTFYSHGRVVPVDTSSLYSFKNMHDEMFKYDFLSGSEDWTWVEEPHNYLFPEEGVYKKMSVKPCRLQLPASFVMEKGKLIMKVDSWFCNKWGSEMCVLWELIEEVDPPLWTAIKILDREWWWLSYDLTRKKHDHKDLIACSDGGYLFFMIPRDNKGTVVSVSLKHDSYFQWQMSPFLADEIQRKNAYCMPLTLMGLLRAL